MIAPIKPRRTSPDQVSYQPVTNGPFKGQSRPLLRNNPESGDRADKNQKQYRFEFAGNNIAQGDCPRKASRLKMRWNKALFPHWLISISVE